MTATLLTREEQTQAAVDNLDVARVAYEDALAALHSSPHDCEARALYEIARARLVFALRMLALAQRRLRLTCRACLHMNEYDLDIRGCLAHFALLAAESPGDTHSPADD